MYKLSIQALEALKKQLEVNNKHLASHEQTPAIKKLIKDNEKQINFLKDEYYID